MAEDKSQNNDELVIPESDVRSVVRLLGRVAQLNGPVEKKKRALMTGLAKLIDADAWSWIVARACDGNDHPAVGSFLHDGMSGPQFAQYVAMMQDRRHTPVEYAELNKLRRRTSHFTRRWDQLVSAEIWYGKNNRRLIDKVGFEHVMYCVSVLDSDGLFSGISLKRITGRPNFTPLQQRIANIVTSEVPWLHHHNGLADVTRKVLPLTPRQQQVLSLLLDGRTVQKIADQLGLAFHTVHGYVRALYKHFGVHSRAELFRRFQTGDGADLP